jgi:hypothetical protein
MGGLGWGYRPCTLTDCGGVTVTMDSLLSSTSFDDIGLHLAMTTDAQTLRHSDVAGAMVIR